MTTLEIIWFGTIFGGFVALLTILMGKRDTGNTIAAAFLCVGFGAFTAVQIGQEGVIGFYANHTQTLTGLQVWWDLVMCAMIALFFIAPRARKVGMSIVPWALFVASTASIGLLAMCARLFWLERAKAES
jgi:hypothetical protein